MLFCEEYVPAKSTVLRSGWECVSFVSISLNIMKSIQIFYRDETGGKRLKDSAVEDKSYSGRSKIRRDSGHNWGTEFTINEVLFKSVLVLAQMI